MKVGAVDFLLPPAATILWGTNLPGHRLVPSEPWRTKPSTSIKASKWRYSHPIYCTQRLTSSSTKHCFCKDIRTGIAFHIRKFTIFPMPKSSWEERWDTMASLSSLMLSRKSDISPKLQFKAKTGLSTPRYCWRTRREILSKRSWGIGLYPMSNTTQLPLMKRTKKGSIGFSTA